MTTSPRQMRLYRLMLASWLLMAACSDDDDDGVDAAIVAGRDAGADEDGGTQSNSELERQLQELKAEQQELERRLAELIARQPMLAGRAWLEGLAQPLLAAVCARAERCCDGGELSLLFGASVVTADDCESVLLEVVQHGADVTLGPRAAPIYALVRDAIARPSVPGLSVSADSVLACAEHLRELACELPDLGRCQPPLRDDPCAPEKLVRASAGSGESCDASALLPQCAPGLVCQVLASGSSGHCALASSVGDRCIDNRDCTGDELYCKPETGSCERRKELGDPCKYGRSWSVSGEPRIDASGHQDNPHARAADVSCGADADCASGFCHLITRKCAQRAAAGDTCSSTPEGQADDCQQGLYCRGARCVPRFAAGAKCEPDVNHGRDCFVKSGGVEPGECRSRGDDSRCGPEALATGKALCDGLPP